MPSETLFVELVFAVLGDIFRGDGTGAGQWECFTRQFAYSSDISLIGWANAEGCGGNSVIGSV